MFFFFHVGDTKQSDQFEILHAVNDNENLHYIIQSPIGKIMVENIDNDNGKKNDLTSKAERHTNNENKSSNANYEIMNKCILLIVF